MDIEKIEEIDGKELLERFCKAGFDSDLRAAALALGREKSELEEMLSGEVTVDEDLVMKMRGIAQERNFDL